MPFGFRLQLSKLFTAIAPTAASRWHIFARRYSGWDGIRCTRMSHCCHPERSEGSGRVGRAAVPHTTQIPRSARDDRKGSCDSSSSSSGARCSGRSKALPRGVPRSISAHKVRAAAAAETQYESVPKPVADYLALDSCDIENATRLIAIDCDVPAAKVERWNDVPKVSEDLSGSAEAIRRHVEELVVRLRPSS